MAMADTPQTASPANYDPQAHYDVKLKKVIFIGDRAFRPGENIRLRGDVMNANPSAIASSTKVGG